MKSVLRFISEPWRAARWRRADSSAGGGAATGFPARLAVGLDSSQRFHGRSASGALVGRRRERHGDHQADARRRLVEADRRVVELRDPLGDGQTETRSRRLRSQPGDESAARASARSSAATPGPSSATATKAERPSRRRPARAPSSAVGCSARRCRRGCAAGSASSRASPATATDGPSLRARSRSSLACAAGASSATASLATAPQVARLALGLRSAPARAARASAADRSDAMPGRSRR